MLVRPKPVLGLHSEMIVCGSTDSRSKDDGEITTLNSTSSPLCKRSRTRADTCHC